MYIFIDIRKTTPLRPRSHVLSLSLSLFVSVSVSVCLCLCLFLTHARTLAFSLSRFSRRSYRAVGKVGKVSSTGIPKGGTGEVEKKEKKKKLEIKKTNVLPGCRGSVGGWVGVVVAGAWRWVVNERLPEARDADHVAAKTR